MYRNRQRFVQVVAFIVVLGMILAVLAGIFTQ